MKQLTCEMCGSTDLVKQDGFFVCQTCGCKYSVEEAKKMMIEGTVDVVIDTSKEISNLVERMYSCLKQHDFEQTKEYCKKILDINIKNVDARFVEKLLLTKSGSNKFIRIFGGNIDKWVESNLYKLFDIFSEIEIASDCLKEIFKKYTLEEITICEPTISDETSKVQIIYSKNKTILHEARDLGVLPISLIIPDGVIEIMDEAFVCCNNLVSVTIPSSVLKIGESAFACHRLVEVINNSNHFTLDKNVEYDSNITDSAIFVSNKEENYKTKILFSGNYLIINDNEEQFLVGYWGRIKEEQDVKLPDDITYICGEAFLGQDFLTSVTIGYNTKEVSPNAFSGCRNLKRVVIGENVTSISGFWGCESLEEIIVSEKNVKYKSVEGNLYSKDGKILIQYANGKTDREFRVPQGVEEICGLSAASLKCVYLPDSISKITGYLPEGATIKFSGCKKQWDKIFREEENDFENIIECLAPNPPENFEEDYEKNESVVLEDADSLDSQADKNVTQVYSDKPTSNNNSSSGCYVATCVYGSYDCPEVWTLRRYRDNTLGSTWYGRAFIRTYYAISPTIVKWFGKTKWFKKMWKGKLDKMVKKLQIKGVESTPYQDKQW